LKKNEMGGACDMNGERTDAYRVLEGKPEGSSPLESPKSGLESNIKMNL
jgi:hypothetical protein